MATAHSEDRRARPTPSMIDRLRTAAADAIDSAPRGADHYADADVLIPAEDLLTLIEAAPPIPPVLYHWSPTARRDSIIDHGLGPGHPSIDGSWRPHYLCLATSPHHAWHLNLQHHRDTSESWDLWLVYTSDMHDPTPRDDYPDEIRTTRPVRDAYLLASRDSTPIVPASVMRNEDIRTAIARSSFGTAEAQAAIASIDPERARRLVDRAVNGGHRG